MKAVQPLPLLALLLVNYAMARDTTTVLPSTTTVTTAKIPLTSSPPTSTDTTSENTADKDRNGSSLPSTSATSTAPPTPSQPITSTDTASVTSTNDTPTTPPTPSQPITSTDTASVTSTNDTPTTPPTPSQPITSTDTASVTSTETSTTNTDDSNASVSTVDSSLTMTPTTIISTIHSTNEMLSTVDALETTTLTPTPTPSKTDSTSSSTAGSSGHCQKDSCGAGRDVSCVNLDTTYFCLCIEEYYYNKTSSECMKGQLFPAEITVRVEKVSDLENKTSQAYESLYNEVTSFFGDVFNHLAYGQTVILKVSTSPSLLARSEMRATGKTVNVSVVNIFEQNAHITEKIISDAITNVTSQNSNIVQYSRKSLCDYYGCKEDGQDCPNRLQCSCKLGLQRPNPQSLFCAPQQCPETCNADFKMQCLQKDNAAPECVCQPGYQRDVSGSCQECPFGYSGMDCKDNFQLILTIVGTIAGVLILVLLIAVIFSVSSKNKKKNVEEQNLIEDDFHNLRLRQTGFSNPGAEGSIFPKVKTAPSRDGLVQNPYVNQGRIPYPDY